MTEDTKMDDIIDDIIAMFDKDEDEDEDEDLLDILDIIAIFDEED
jgi:hypothetical protein